MFKKHCVTVLSLAFAVFTGTSSLTAVNPLNHLGRDITTFLQNNSTAMMQIGQLIGEEFHYYQSRGADICLPNIPVTYDDGEQWVNLRLQLRWGYRGAGNPAQPFTGFTGKLHLEFSYDGITVNVLKSHTLRKKFAPLINRLTQISPTEEFLFKVGQLLATESHTTTNDVVAISKEVTTLLKRLEITPAAQTLASHPLIQSFINLFALNPTYATLLLLQQSKRALGLLGIVTQPLSEKHRALLQDVIEQVSYTTPELTLVFPADKSTLTFSFDSAGSGIPDTPLRGATLTRVTTHDDGTATTVTTPLTPEWECCARIIVLFIAASKNDSHLSVSDELATLLSRLAATPFGSARELRALLTFMCSYYRHVTSFDFDTAPQASLDTGGLLTYLLSISYQNYVLRSTNTAHETIRTFVSLHIGHALRQYALTQGLDEVVKEQLSLDTPTQKSMFDLPLIIRTLLVTP